MPDASFLSDLRQAAEVIVAIASTALLLWIAPGVALGWLRKLMYISVILGIWNVFVQPYLAGFKSLIIYELAWMVYPILTERTVINAYQALLFLITFKLFIWIFDIQKPHHSNHSNAGKH